MSSISLEYFKANVFQVPDYAHGVICLSGNGTWVVGGDGWVQHAFEVTNDTGWYKTIMTINGAQVNAVTIPNTVATGIYDYAGQIFPVKLGDAVTVALTFSGGTIVNYNNLVFYPVR